MKKDRGFSAIILIILAALVAGGFIYFFSGKVNKSNNSQLSEESKTKSNQEVKLPQQAKVSISKEGFIPTTMVVKSGTQVTWENQDSAPHRVASDPHPTHTLLPDLDSKQDITSGDSFSFIFNKKGTFTYHDDLNPLKFKGTVVVE